MLVTCRECAAEISNTAKACPKCGAPASVAFPKSAEPKPRASSSPKEKRIQTRPGFAQGAFGKATAIVLLIYAALASLGVAMSWFGETPSTEGVGYRVGQGIAMFALVGGAWRGIMPRKHRTWIDWLVAVFLLFVAVVTLPAVVVAASTINVDSPDVGASIVLALTAVQVVISTIVAIRLLRQPYYPPKEALQTIFE